VWLLAGGALVVYAALVVAAHRRRSRAIDDAFGRVHPDDHAQDSIRVARGLLWRAHWIAVVTRCAVVALLGFTPLGAWWIRTAAPSADAAGLTFAYVVLALVVLSPVLLRRRLGRSAWALAPHLRPPPHRRSYVLLASAFVVLNCYNAIPLMRTITDTELVGITVGACVASGLLLFVVPGGPAFQVVATSERLQAILDSAPYPIPAGVRIQEGSTSITPYSPIATDAFGSRGRILVPSSFLADSSVDDVHAVIAHELAHVAHHDGVLTRVRCVLQMYIVLMSAIGLSELPALRTAAGLHSSTDPAGFALLLACGYAMIRLLWPIELAARRAVECGADEAMVRVIGDRESCHHAISNLSERLGSPTRWSRGQLLLVAGHPAVHERLARLDAAATQLAATS
jgi:Zn-dependent protease with chaperone function